MSEMNEKAKVCPRCGKRFPPEAQFCPDCGVMLFTAEPDSKPTYEEVKAQDATRRDKTGVFANLEAIFSNPGAKIRKIAKIAFFFGMISAVGLAIFLFYLASQTWNKGVFIILGIFALTVLPLLFWEISLYLYGYGEVIDKTGSIERLLREKSDKEQ